MKWKVIVLNNQSQHKSENNWSMFLEKWTAQACKHLVHQNSHDICLDQLFLAWATDV